MKTKWLAPAFSVLLVYLFPILSAADHEASELLRYKDENTGLTILRAKVSLPAPGYWTPVPGVTTDTTSLREVFLDVSNEENHALLTGRRMSRRAELKEIESAQWPLRQLSWPISLFAEKHDGRLPKSLEEIKKEIGEHSLKQLAESYHVFQDRLAIDLKQTAADARIVAFETTPVIDDGKHWVLLSNGNTERREIHPELAATPGVKIKARRPVAAPEVKAVEYAILARVTDEKPATIRVKNILTDKTIDIRIDPAKAAVGEREVLGKWAMLRMWSLPLDGEGSAAILPHWFQQAPALYGINPEEFGAIAGFSGRRERGRSTSIFNVFGGRSAISETLQMQDIAVPQTTASGGEMTPISEIQGVEVKSHPFEEMLGEKEGGRIALAEVIPADHLFAYFPKPAGLISWLDGGAEFLFNAGASATGRSLEYGLSERYTAALGMEREWMRRLLDSGAVEEIAIAVPDLFLIEGTEVTVVARLKNPVIAAGLLRLIGINNLDTTTVHKGPDGSTSHWARRGDLLIVSTHADELDQVLKLEAAGGKGSLGQSAELRYMLTKLPLRDSTKAFVYLSDPFIRRLVGPQTKIPQHRRIRARSEMEALVAGSLLYQLDGHQGGNAADLLAKKYVSAPRVATDAVLDPASGAVSKTFGSLPWMHSLKDLDITTATAEETAAYQQYLENYNQFWRRFFDPIAIRIDQPEPATYELSVFILPLIDNSIYNSLREIVTDSDDASVLKIPVIEPEPIATLSMNLTDKIWVDGGGEVLENFAMKAGLDTTILDFLGPDLHLSLADADPILEMGSGELSHIFGSMSGGNDMMMISTIVSIFTRPTAISIGLSEPAAVRRALDGSVGRGSKLAGMNVTGSLYKIAGKDGWVYRINFFDMMTLRLGIEVQDRFLVIRNMPLTSEFRITGMKDATQPGAQLSVSPRACRLQLPALFASAAERERSAAFSGISDLYPLLATGKRSISEAAEMHKAWFGFRPVHPGDGKWAWDGEEVSSNRFGTGGRPTQPSYQAGNRDFGILHKVDGGEVGMRFEDDGLRTTLRWQLRPMKK